MNLLTLFAQNNQNGLSQAWRLFPYKRILYINTCLLTAVCKCFLFFTKEFSEKSI